MKIIEDRYLGDGVYASFDGWHIILDLRAQASTLPITRIALEPPVIAQLDEYRKDIDRLQKEASAAGAGAKS